LRIIKNFIACWKIRFRQRPENQKLEKLKKLQKKKHGLEELKKKIDGA